MTATIIMLAALAGQPQAGATNELTAKAVIVLESHDALDEVNAARKRRGLRPFLRDKNLVAGAMHVARFRAERRIRAHTRNDFGGLPRGCRASAAGCAAWPPSHGWGSCCWTETWTYAGAGWCIGSDGLRYMQIFVR